MLVEPVEESVFLYQTDLEILAPEVINTYNPYYEIAYHYEPFDSASRFGDARTAITRGPLEGVFLPNMTSDIVVSSNTSFILENEVQATN